MIVGGYSNIATVFLLRRKTFKPMLAHHSPLDTRNGSQYERDGLPEPALEETCSGCAKNVL